MKQIRAIAKWAFQKLIGKVRWLELQLNKGNIDKNTYYDSLTQLVMEKVLTPSSVCIDVGCHAGSILSLMMKYVPNGRFLAFEPLPNFYEKLLIEF